MKNLLNNYKVVKELTIISGTLLVLFLWLSARNSDNVGWLLGFVILDQINSRFAIKWTEKLHV